MIFDVAHDEAGMETALYEMLEEGFRARELNAQLEKANTPERRVGILARQPARTLAHGYYLFAGYLFWLDELIESRVQIGTLSAVEARGLCALKAARSKFRSEHPECSQCGAMQKTKYAPSCFRCEAKFITRAA